MQSTQWHLVTFLLFQCCKFLCGGVIPIRNITKSVAYGAGSPNFSKVDKREGQHMEN